MKRRRNIRLAALLLGCGLLLGWEESARAVYVEGIYPFCEDEKESELDTHQLMASFQTSSTSEYNRNRNLYLACEAIDGMILEPGEEFSFNEATGKRTTEKGYLPATAYLYGEEVQQPGGGVCQVSTTLYNAVVAAGLESTARRAHTYAPEYVPCGEDAAVSYGGPDFKFRNSSEFPIEIEASSEDGEVEVSIYGVPILEDGEELHMESERESPGSNTWITYLVQTKDGQEVERKKFHISTYR